MTAQKQAEMALRASEERYRQVEEHAPIGLALVALDGRWLRIPNAVTYPAMVIGVAFGALESFPGGLFAGGFVDRSMVLSMSGPSPSDRLGVRRA